MSLTIGTVTVSPDGTYAVSSPTHMAPALFLARVSVAGLPDPNNPRRATITVAADGGDTVVSVDSTTYLNTGPLGSFTVADGVTAATYRPRIVGSSPTTLTITPALPAGLVWGPGTVLGFQGTDDEWEDTVLPQLVAQLEGMAATAVAEATALVSVLTSTMDVNAVQPAPGAVS